MTKRGIGDFSLSLLLIAVTLFFHLRIQAAQESAKQNNPAQESIELPAIVEGYVWDGEVHEIAPTIKRVLQTTVILNQSYRSPEGVPLHVSIVYAGKTRRSLHFPEVCIVGQGWQLQKQETITVGLEFTAKRLVIVKGDQSQAVLYFFKTDEYLTGNYFLNAWFWSRAQFTGGAPTSALIRFSAPITLYGEEAAFELLDDAAKKFKPVILEQIK